MKPLTRRTLLRTGAATAGTAALARGSAPAQAVDAVPCAALPPRVAVAPPGGRIDVHAHHVPDIYRQALLAAGMPNPGGYPTPVWSPERATGFMDDYGIQMQVLSISDPGVTFLPPDKAKTLARQINEYTAELIKDQPTRFGGYALLPLPDIQASLDEIAYALDTLKLDGVGLLSSYEGTNVAMLPKFEQIWEELNRRKAFVFLHPTALPADDKPSSPLPDFLVEFTFETTRFCCTALNTGLTTRYPDVRIQLAHAGGAYPYLSYRVGVLQTGVPNQVFPDADPATGVLPASQTKGFFYDTGLAPSPAAMRSVLEVSDINHVLFGTDWPYTELLFQVPGDPQPELSLTFADAKRHAVERANIAAQLPGVAARLKIPAADRRVAAKLVRLRTTTAKNGHRRLRLVLDADEPIQVHAVLSHHKRKLASTTFKPIAKGRRALSWTLPERVSDFHSARLTLTLTDGFGNQKTLHRTVRS